MKDDDVLKLRHYLTDTTQLRQGHRHRFNQVDALLFPWAALASLSPLAAIVCVSKKVRARKIQWYEIVGLIATSNRVRQDKVRSKHEP